MGTIRIKDYFKTNRPVGFSKEDWEDWNEVRRHLNNDLKSDAEKHEYIYTRRTKPEFVRRDFELFQIPEEDTINRFSGSKTVSKYYGEHKNTAAENKESSKKLNVGRKKKMSKNGKVKKNSKISNIASNLLHKTKPGKATMFVINNIEIVAKVSLVVLALFIIATLAIFIAGTLSSIGATPFVLCGNKDDTWTITHAMETSNIEQMATKEYGCEVFIFAAKQNGWKDEAIIGVLSYILQEGGAMGTFTYEGNYKWNGPSGEFYDKTLDNASWVSWLPNEGKEQAHSWYEANTSHYAAIGLGLIQSSDVWEEDGTMDAAWASELIAYADSMGKPWQDPQTQMSYYFTNVFAKSTAFDEEGVDPTLDERTSEEWCRRITAGVGMPAMSYTDDDDYMEDHTRHITEAEELFSLYTGVNIRSIDFNVTNLCDGYNPNITGGNATIADAAVTLAGVDGREDIIEWDMNGPDSPKLNDFRLKTYKAVHIAIFPGDDLFASCDRSSACAIRWSGADDTFPPGDTAVQYEYISNSDKWTFVGYFGSVDLVAGDVLITEGKGHIKIYIGEFAIEKRFPGSASDMYAGAFEEFFPLLYEDNGGDDRVYAVYRCVAPDNSGLYNNIIVN